jgi:hypothetical protein
MCPTDTTPDPRDMQRMPESQEIPEPTPDAAGHAPREPGKPDIAHRPQLPDRPEIMAADIEDEEADPVVDQGPGIADGPERGR